MPKEPTAFPVEIADLKFDSTNSMGL